MALTCGVHMSHAFQGLSRRMSFLPSPLQLVPVLHWLLFLLCSVSVVSVVSVCQVSYPLVANNVRLLCDEESPE